MRPSFVGLLTLLLGTGVLAGCSNRGNTKMEGPKGGPGAEAVREQVEKGAKASEVKGPGENTFAIIEPKEVNVAPGAEAKATVSIDRGKQFKQAVTLTFKPDDGITVVPEKAEIKAGQDKAD